MTTFTLREIRAYNTICSQEFELELVAGLIDGKPGVALAITRTCDGGQIGVLPLFVGFKDGIVFDFFSQADVSRACDSVASGAGRAEDDES